MTRKITSVFILLFIILALSVPATAANKLDVYNEVDLGASKSPFGLVAWDYIRVAVSSARNGKFDMAWLQPGTVFTIYYGYNGNFDIIMGELGVGFSLYAGNTWGGSNGGTSVVRAEDGSIIDLDAKTIQTTYAALLNKFPGNVFVENAPYADIGLIIRSEEPEGNPISIRAVTFGTTNKDAEAPWTDVYKAFGGLDDDDTIAANTPPPRATLPPTPTPVAYPTEINDSYLFDREDHATSAVTQTAAPAETAEPASLDNESDDKPGFAVTAAAAVSGVIFLACATVLILRKR